MPLHNAQRPLFMYLRLRLSQFKGPCLPCRFYHAFDNYMTHAFPHDELKPLSKSFTDSLGQFLSLVHSYLQGAYAATS